MYLPTQFINLASKCHTFLFKKSIHTSSKALFAWVPFTNNSTKMQMNEKDLYGQNMKNKFDYLRSLNINAENHSLRLSSVICTIGPASSDVKTLEMMMKAGMTIARLNFSHGTHDYHLNTVKTIRSAVKNYNKKINGHYSLAIALDTKGPEIRTGLLGAGNDNASKEVKLNKGEKIRLSTDKQFEKSCSNKILYVDYVNITKVVKKSDKIYVDDGLILLTAMEVGENYIDCLIENDGMLGSRKGINLPSIDVDLPAVSAKDKDDLKFAVKHDLDMIFASFIREASAVNEIRDILGDKGKNILIVPKIENHQGIQNLQSIIEVSDGIMVARGDMGIEIPPEKVFLAQKSIIAQCNVAGKPVICATQMLESMIDKPRATRAESSDVANAIMDGADCVMLSGETAKGKYPVECVRFMDKLCREAESAMWRDQHFHDLVSITDCATDTTQETAISAVTEANDFGAAAIVVMPQASRMAHMIAKFRPRNAVLFVTNDHRVARQCNLYRGIIPVLYSPKIGARFIDLNNQYLIYALSFGMCHRIFNKGNVIVLVKEPITEENNCTDIISKFVL